MPPSRFAQASAPAPSRGVSRFAQPPQAPPTTPRVSRFASAEPPDVDFDVDPAPAEEGSILPVVGGGAAALGGAALLAKTPGAAGKLFRAVNAIRQQLMLSGLALPKSILGGVGAGVEAAVEGRGLRALKEILSKQTLKDSLQSFKTGSGININPAGATSTELPKAFSIPGRLIGGFDEGIQKALVRSGTTAEEARAATLQAKLPPRFRALESEPVKALIPFRRTPFNQFFEGFGKLTDAAEGNRAAQRGVAAFGGAGAALGAATAEDDFPVSIPLAVAASGRGGVSTVLGALLGRSLAGGNIQRSGIASQATPVSDFSLEQVMDPRKVLGTFRPAALTALERLTGR